MKAVMRKLSFFLFHTERDAVISKLQDLGLVHVEIDDARVNERITDLRDERAKYTEAIRLIKEYAAIFDAEEETTETAQPTHSTMSAEEIRDTILGFQRDIEEHEKNLEMIDTNRKALSPWGSFDRNRLEGLRENGVSLRFFSGLTKEVTAFNFGKAVATPISRSGSTTYFVIVETTTPREYPFDELTLPPTSLSELETEDAALRKGIVDLQRTIAQHTPDIETLEEAVRGLNDTLAYEETQISLNSFEKSEGKIFHITGWIPKKIEKRVTGYLDEKNISYLVGKPERGDKIPVILKTGPARPFEPITKLFQLPNYYEFDLTPMIAVFYPILFAYCLGDTGYGIIIMLASIIGMFTVLKKAKSIAALGIILGLSTAVMGIINSGIIFGVQILNVENIAFINRLHQYVLLRDGQFWSPFNTSLIIGIFLIHVAVVLSIFNKIRFGTIIDVLVAVGKLVFLPGLILLFLVDLQQMEAVQFLKPIYPWLLGAGAALLVFPNFAKGFSFNTVLDSFLGVYFAVTGLLGDVLSYIRLFALGVSSAILGLVVNNIGATLGEGLGGTLSNYLGDTAGGIIGTVIMVIFLVVGHTGNLMLAALGSFVHPLRLTFVEFYNNFEFQGGGVEYRPLKRTVIESDAN